jgi:hypothetical protein
MMQQQLNVADFDDVKSGFVISFAFEDGNPFLVDAALAKEFRFTADGSLSVSSTVPQWRDDRGAPFAALGEGSGSAAHRTRSFFQWFTTSENLAAQHDPIADFIRDDLWGCSLPVVRLDCTWTIPYWAIGCHQLSSIEMCFDCDVMRTVSTLAQGGPTRSSSSRARWSG